MEGDKPSEGKRDSVACHVAITMDVIKSNSGQLECWQAKIRDINSLVNIKSIALVGNDIEEKWLLVRT